MPFGFAYIFYFVMWRWQERVLLFENQDVRSVAESSICMPSNLQAVTFSQIMMDGLMEQIMLEDDAQEKKRKKMEVEMIKQRIQAARDRQKSYADLKRKSMEFQVGDKVMLKVSPWKGVVHFSKRGKLNPRYVGPFEVLEKVRAVAYKLELPQELSRVHNTFHVSNLKKCYSDEPLVIPLDGLHIDDKLHFVEEPVEIMDREVKRLRYPKVFIRVGLEFTSVKARKGRQNKGQGNNARGAGAAGYRGAQLRVGNANPG
ncbi:hypothetical protein Tco_0567456 [Tanacetum coccineum]